MLFPPKTAAVVHKACPLRNEKNIIKKWMEILLLCVTGITSELM